MASRGPVSPVTSIAAASALRKRLPSQLHQLGQLAASASGPPRRKQAQVQAFPRAARAQQVLRRCHHGTAALQLPTATAGLHGRLPAPREAQPQVRLRPRRRLLPVALVQVQALTLRILEVHLQQPRQLPLADRQQPLLPPLPPLLRQLLQRARRESPRSRRKPQRWRRLGKTPPAMPRRCWTA